ncbi:hypothetical protein JCGZ_05982 [Jatropha curcas]|uniref:Uncharacterized protein n=1 Tax=Jatropha curcas TaxID=180498 RepID=A0A067KR99_JATCU|nr:hypothetical protein JCGZ_05982 [Jatropha curcas]
MSNSQVLVRCGTIRRYFLGERVHVQVIGHMSSSELGASSFDQLPPRLRLEFQRQSTLEWAREISIAVGHLKTTLSEALTWEDFVKIQLEEAKGDRRRGFDRRIFSPAALGL